MVSAQIARRVFLFFFWGGDSIDGLAMCHLARQLMSSKCWLVLASRVQGGTERQRQLASPYGLRLQAILNVMLLGFICPPSSAASTPDDRKLTARCPPASYDGPSMRWRTPCRGGKYPKGMSRSHGGSYPRALALSSVARWQGFHQYSGEGSADCQEWGGV